MRKRRRPKAKKETRIEVRDGKEYVVTTYPSDRRLAPSATKQRTLWAALDRQEKKNEITRRKKVAKKAARKRRKKARPMSGDWSIRHEGKLCRQRESWGGFHLPDICACTGKCAYDEARERSR